METEPVLASIRIGIPILETQIKNSIASALQTNTLPRKYSPCQHTVHGLPHPHISLASHKTTMELCYCHFTFHSHNLITQEDSG